MPKTYTITKNLLLVIQALKSIVNSLIYIESK